MNDDSNDSATNTNSATNSSTDGPDLSSVTTPEPSATPAPTEPTTPEPADPPVEPEPSAEEETADPEPEQTTETEEEKPAEEKPAAVTSGGGGSKKKKVLLTILGILLLVGLGYAGYKAFVDKPVTVTKVTVVKQQSVPLIRVGAIDGTANSFYPSTDDTSTTSYQVNNQVFEGLVQFQNVSKIAPRLATSWTNPDDSTWVFNLKSGVKFHDGKTMTADDVKYSLEKYQADALGGVFTFDAKEITAVSANKVKIVTDGPDPLLLHKLAYLAIMNSTTNKPSDPGSGTGPYTVKEGTTPTETEVDLVAFNQYHGGTPKTKEVQYKVYSTEDELAKDVADGKVDYTTGIDTEENLAGVKKSKLTTVSDTGIGVTSLGINVNKKGSPLQNLKFRQAIAAAISKAQVITDANLKAEPASQVVTEDVPGYNNTIKLTKADTDKAKQLLTEAGYPNGASFTISYNKDLAQDQIDSITTQLKAINVTVKQDPYTDFDALIDKVFTTGTDSYFLSYTTDLLDSSDVLSALFQGNLNYSNATLDTDLEKASTTLDPAKRLAFLQNGSKVVIEDVAEVPIYSLNFNMTYDPSLMITRDTYNSTYFWQVYKKG